MTDTLAKAKELTNGKNIPDSIIGLQGRVSPVTLRIKEILAAGTIGKILSSDVRSYGGLLPRDKLWEPLSYFADRKIGGNHINIKNGHALDYIHEVLGEYESFHSSMQIQRPSVQIVDKQGKVLRSVTSDVPDLLVLQGTLKAREGNIPVARNALLSYTFRHGPPFKGEPESTWSINGEKGELLITMAGGHLHSHVVDPISIKFHNHMTNEVEELGWEWQDWQKELPVRARMISELYERYAEWVEGGRGKVKEGRAWPTIEDAIVRMEQFEKIYEEFDAQQ